MITNGFITFIYYIIYGLFLTIPDGGLLPDVIHEAAVSISTSIYLWNFVFPLDTLFWLIMHSLLIILGIASIKAVIWVMNMLRGNNASLIKE